MKHATATTLSVIVLLPLVTGCQTQEQTGELVGAGSGALLGGLIGNALGGQTGTWIGAAVGAGLGGLVGSAIGSRLDEQDRQLAAAATRQALAQPVDYPTASATVAPPPQPVSWTSQKNANVSGSSTVTSVRKQSDGGECRMVRETAYIKGQEVVETTRYCRSMRGDWEVKA